MSDDLISRKAVLNILTEARIKDTLLASPTFIEMLRQRTKELPAAYDKEKVIEELEARKSRKLDYCIEFAGANSIPKAEFKAFGEAIEIVEKGGIE